MSRQAPARVSTAWLLRHSAAEAEKGDSLFFRDELHRMSGELPGPSKPCGAARAQPSGTGS